MVKQVGRRTRLVGLVMLVALFAAPVGWAQAALVWQTESVDATSGPVGFTSLALDSAGQPRISYYGGATGDLMYAAFNGSSWQVETVDSEGDVGRETSLALDGAGQPHISYADNDNTDLKYARFDGVAWQIEIVDSVGVVGYFTSLALDDAGLPHISYYDLDNDDLKHATFDGASWQIEIVDSVGDVGYGPSLALDSQNQPHISYFNGSSGSNGGLMYAAFDGAGWQVDEVDATALGGITSGSSLALDSADQPHIGYFDASNQLLKYAAFDGTNWQTEIVAADVGGTVGWDPSLALDSEDQPHISYYHYSNQDLEYASFDGTDWQRETVDAEGNVGYFTSLALDGAGQPHISYSDFTNNTLKYAHGQQVNAPPTVDAGGPYTGTEGSPISLQGDAIDPDTDGLTTTWSYTTDSADPGTTCTFGDASLALTTFTCTDDGTFTVTLEADDGVNPATTDTATVTISNANPSISDATGVVSGPRVTVTVDASDPGENDALGYTFDCDNDGAYEVDAGDTNEATCFLGGSEGAFQINVQVTDDDGGVTDATVIITITTELCASNHTGVLRYTSNCQDFETAVSIPGEEPVEICASASNGQLRLPLTGSCAGQETSYILPEDGPLNVCVNNYTLLLRAVDDLDQCTSHEVGRVIAATEVGELPPPRIR